VADVNALAAAGAFTAAGETVLLGGAGGGAVAAAPTSLNELAAVCVAADVHQTRRPMLASTMPTVAAPVVSQARARLRTGSGGVSCELSLSVALGPSCGALNGAAPG
jgi:hypothetical protein